MSADRLLGYYEQVADAPNAVAQLRRFVLDLAVRGKLTQQNLEERPLRITHNQLDRPQPFKIPRNWEWLRIGDQLDLINGMAFKPTDWIKSGLRIVRIQNLNNRDAPFNFCDYRQARERSLIDDGSFLISWSGTPGTSFGAFIWDRGPAVLNQHIFRCDFKTDAFSASFLRIAINGRLDEMIAKAHGGVGLQHITKGKLEELLIPLPPLAEQHRIVAKVDEWMGLCDRLESARMGREAARDRLAASILARLDAPDSETFHADARLALDALPELTTQPDQIKKIRKTILNLAVHGKLVPHEPSEETASNLLRRIRIDEDSLSSGKIASKNNEASGLNKPFDCPAGWRWTTVQGLLDGRREISYGVIKLGDEPKSGGIPTLRCSDVRQGYIDFSSIRKIHESIESDYKRTRLRGGEIVINIRGTLGGVALIPSNLAGFNVAREVAVIPIANDICGKFVVYLMLSPYFWGNIQNNLRGIAYKGLNLGILRNISIPLPPLAEQCRIVDKVDQLMALCDKIEENLSASNNTRRRLLDALLAEALATDEDHLLEAAE